MKYAIIENNKVVNIAESESALAPNWKLIPNDKVVFIGTEIINGEFVEVPEQVNSLIEMNALIWLREHLTSAKEYVIRKFSKSTDANAPDVAAFMMMIDARINHNLIVSDTDYAFGIKTLFDNALIDQNEATALLELGGHDANAVLGV